MWRPKGKIISPPLNNDFEDYKEFEKWYNILIKGMEIYKSFLENINNPCYPLSELEKFKSDLIERRDFIKR